MTTSGIDVDMAVAWLTEAARYFGERPTCGEDAAFWANVANAENCRRIASLLARQEELLAEAGDSITPFANFAADNTVDDASGWAGGIWAGNRCERERIVDWFGPSDFRAAARLSDKLGER